VLRSYRFERGKGLFDRYVLEHYNEKRNASDNISKQMAKLFLNSLYGKFGMKDIENHMGIIPNEKVKKIVDSYNYKDIEPINEEYSLVKYSGKLPESIRK
jgi:hypothetical protein